MWSLRVCTRKKRASHRLNLTPTPDLGALAKAEAPSGPGRKLSAHCKRRVAGLRSGTRGGLGLSPRDLRGPRAGLQGFFPEACHPLLGLKRSGKTRGLQRITEKSERSRLGGSSSGPPSTQLRGTGEKSLHENSTSEEAQDEKIAPLSESVTDDLQVDRSLSNSERVSGLSLQHDISSSLLSYSITDSYTEHKTFEESLSSFPSPELFRGSDYLDWECPMLEENLLCKNSTLLDTSKAVPIQKALQFSNLSAILGTSSEDYQKCHRKVMMMLADQSISPKPKSTASSESDNASCGVLLAEKNYPSTPQKTKKKPEKDPEPRDTSSQTTLSSHHLNIKVPSSHQRSVVESSAGRSVAKVLLPQPLKPALNTHSSTSDKKSRGLLTSTPSSQTASLMFPSNTSEICCIIKASPGTRQVESKAVIVRKKKYSLPKDTPEDIIIKTSGRM
ncbi:meiosis-specific kinetochore protein [Tursiops truncatus]|uniref:meiosis-specific kinetochore protein n=1 Tax=Tursiops truncatus TaxID=9739 RepID=UPI003CCFCBA8